MTNLIFEHQKQIRDIQTYPFVVVKIIIPVSGSSVDERNVGKFDHLISIVISTANVNV